MMCETWDQMTRRHKRERREMVEAFAAQRVTQAVAAKHLNTTRTCLNNYIRRNKIFWPAMSRGQPKPKIDAAGIFKMYVAGATVDQVAKAFGHDRKYIKKALASAGVGIRGRHPARDNPPHGTADHSVTR